MRLESVGAPAQGADLQDICHGAFQASGWHPPCIGAGFHLENAMGAKNQGEGNGEADRRYRRGVRETVRETTEEERARDARDLTPEEQEEARHAEEQGKAKKRPASSERKT